MPLPPSQMKGPIRSPILLEDANTISHVYWNGSALVDTKGVGWTMSGTVPQVARTSKTQAGAGPFSGANLYKTTAANDVFDGLTGNFTVAIIFKAVSELSWLLYAADIGAETLGWSIYTNGTKLNSRFPGGANNGTATGDSVVGIPNIVFLGRQGGVTTTAYIRLNTNATVSWGCLAAGAAVGSSTVIGSSRDDGAGATFSGIIYEVYATSTAFSDAACVAMAARVKQKLRISGW